MNVRKHVAPREADSSKRLDLVDQIMPNLKVGRHYSSSIQIAIEVPGLETDIGR
jgi:hypothetical protein